MVAKEAPLLRKASKVALVGLANAGKTSIKNMFFENWSKEMVSKISPTIDVEITQKIQEFLRQGILVIDFGGQTPYREGHLERQELWKDISVLLYVIDIQDPDSFVPARDYLRNAWKLVLSVNPHKPKFCIFLHKYDVTVRNKVSVNENVSLCLAVFAEFLADASFHMTTITDGSSNIALIKTLYTSLPEVVLKSLFEQEFLDHFEKNILPSISFLAQEESFYDRSLKPRVRKSAVKAGLSYGLSFQKAWLDFLSGDWKAPQRNLTSRSVQLWVEGQSMYLKIFDWTDLGISKELTTTLLDGMLEGVLRTFHLNPPKIVMNGPNYTTWKIDV